jgi:hypothetical protein
MLAKKIAAILFFFKEVMPANDYKVFSNCMDNYEKLAAKGVDVYPDPHTGNNKMDKLIMKIIQDLASEDANETAQASGIDISKYGDLEQHVGGVKRVGQGRYGYNYVYPYWYYPWWTAYWYNAWAPYYWWGYYPIRYY